jgi:hypothetical protein
MTGREEGEVLASKEEQGPTVCVDLQELSFSLPYCCKLFRLKANSVMREAG